MANKKVSFVVLALTREDVEYALDHVGIRPPAELPDWETDQIASKVSDALYEMDLWSIVVQVAEEVMRWRKVK